jgi:Cys-tRNA(Pro)/Cys-tRNA(Cys) deacylase
MNSENPLSSANLQQFIDGHQIEATILTMPFHTPTVPDAARALNVAEAQIVKSLVFVVNNSPLLVIANGTAKVDYRFIAAHFGINRKKIKFATAEQALDITGYVTGSMPPFGHRQPLPTLIDPAITRLTEIYGGGGDIDAMLRLTPTELLRVTRGTLVCVSKDE